MTITVCAPQEFLRRLIIFCPVCKSRRRFVSREAAWYGAIFTCCGCGDSFGDGERLMRPARRGWRAEETAKAKRLWKSIGPYDPEAHKQWLREQFGEQPVEDVPAGGAL